MALKGKVDSSDSSEEENEDESESETETEDQAKRSSEGLRKDLLLHGKLAFMTIIVGAGILHFVEGLGHVEALYVITQVVTTIGYGDITFQTDLSRLFMSFFVLWLLVELAYFLNTVMQSMLVMQESRLRDSLKKVELTWVQKQGSPHSGEATPAQELVRTEREVEDKFQKTNKLLWASVIFAAHILFGMLFYHYSETCSCSYGFTEIQNCTEATACQAGSTKSWSASFYMAIVTLTSVGFGDVTPSTRLGRIVGIPWMLSGILSTALFIQAIQNTFLNMEISQKLNDKQLTKELFKQIDSQKKANSAKGCMSKVEFLSFVLIQHGLVDQATLDHLFKLYDAMDVNHDEVVTFQELENFARTLVG